MEEVDASPRGSRSRAFELYVAAAVSCFLVAQSVTYAWSFYLRRMSFDDQFHPGSDFPGSVVDASIHNPDAFNVGVHFFGDFWITFLLSREPSPYITPAGVAGSNYPPFAQFLFTPLTWLPYPAALIIFLLASLGLITVPFWRALNSQSLFKTTGKYTLAVILTYPVLFAFDRGNNVLIAVGLVLWATDSLKRNRSHSAALLIGLSAAIKIYPVFFLLIFVVRRKWRSLLAGIGAAVTATMIPLALYSGGIADNIKAFVRNTSVFRDGGGQISLNHSLYAWFLTIRESNWGSLSNLAAQAVVNYRLVCVLLVGSLGVLIVIRKAASTLDIIVICASLNCLLVPITYGYAHAFMLTIALVLLFESEYDITTKALSVLLALLLTSKGIPLGPPYARLLNYVNAPLIVLMLGVTVARLTWGYRARGELPLSLDPPNAIRAAPHRCSEAAP